MKKLLSIFLVIFISTISFAKQHNVYLPNDHYIANGGSITFGSRNLSSGFGRNSIVLGENGIASGDYSIAEGFFPIAIHNYAYVFNGDPLQELYASHGIGSFNINPNGGISKFYIGETNLIDHIHNIGITNFITVNNETLYITSNPTITIPADMSGKSITINNDQKYIADNPTFTIVETNTITINGEKQNLTNSPSFDISLGDLSNVEINNPSQGQILIYTNNGTENNPNYFWTNATLEIETGGVKTVNDWSGDVDIESASDNVTIDDSDNKKIKISVSAVTNINGNTDYVSIKNPNNDSTILIDTLTDHEIKLSLGTVPIGKLSDVSLTEQLVNGQVLTYSDNNWINSTLPSAPSLSWTPVISDSDVNKFNIGQLVYGTTTYNINIPTNNSAFNNDANYIQLSDVPLGDYVKKAGDTMSGILINTQAIVIGEESDASGQNSFAGGIKANAVNDNAFVWNGVDDDSTYSSQDDGTFNVNTTDNIEGFYIGESNLYQYVFERLLQQYIAKGYSKSKNVDELIANEEKLWELIAEYADYKGIRSASNIELRDSEDNEEQGDQGSFLLGAPSTSSIDSDIWPDGLIRPVLQYTFNRWGAKIINSGTDGMYGNASLLGDVYATTNEDLQAPCNIIINPDRPRTVLDIEARTGLANQNATCTEDYDPILNSDFTIMCWLRRNGGATAARILADMGGTTSGNGFQFKFAQVSGHTELQLVVSNATAKTAALKDPTDSTVYILEPSDTNWYHVAVVHSSRNNNSTFYVTKSDMESTFKKSVSTALPMPIAKNRTGVWIGQESGGNSDNAQFKGYIDDVMIFTNSLTDEQVLWWMQQDDSDTDTFPVPEITTGIAFGQFDPATEIYTAEQIQNMQHGSVETPSTFGQLDPKDTIYTTEQVDFILTQ